MERSWMISYYTFGFLLASILISAQSRTLCTNCYTINEHQVNFTCYKQNCDAFLWPRDTPLPSNLECSYDVSKPSSSNCYVLAGLDSTGKYHKFIGINQLTDGPRKDTNDEHNQLSFGFQQSTQKLIITANFAGNTFQGQLLTHPDINFTDVQEALNGNQFKILTKGGEIIKLKVGFYTLQLKNKLILNIKQLQNSLQQLQIKFNQQYTNEAENQKQKFNAKIGERVQKLQAQNEFLKNQIVKISKKLNDFNTSSTSLKNQVTQTSSKLTQTERTNLQLKNRLGSVQKKVLELFKLTDNYDKNASNTESRVVAVQQRVATNDMTINQLRQMFGTMDRRFAQVEKNLKTQKNITTLVHKFLTKLNRNLKTPELTQIDSLIQTISVSFEDNMLQQLSSNQTGQDVQSPDVVGLKQYTLTQLSNHSRVVTSEEEVSTLQTLFAPKKILKLELLFRASQNQFSAALFHKFCDKIPDTLVLFETQFNKKIGGFTPLLWDGNKNGEYMGDQTGQSFIFSLTNEDKFALDEKDKAIWNHVNYGPVFGSGADFSICDEANQKGLSYTDISKSYLNPKYKQRDRESWEMFSGNMDNSWHFKVKEWEVWRIEFESVKQVIEVSQ